jgi:nicotinamidase-related amidase
MPTLSNPVLFERLTPDNAALLLIDMQTGLMLGVTTSSSIALKNNVLGLAEVGKVFGLPTLLTTSAATGPNGPYMPEVVAMFPGQEVMNRTLVNAWDDRAFVAAVEKTGRRKLIIAGITTDVCVLFPALAAVEAGYDVYAVVDASGSFNPQTEQAALMRMTQAGVKVTGWTSVAAELQRDWSLPVAQEAGKVLGQYLTAMGYLADNMAAQQAAGTPKPEPAHA